VHVDDVVAVNLWCLDRRDLHGLYNVGTGTARTFNDVAGEIIRWHGRGRIEYMDFPPGLEERYQSYTRCDPAALRGAGYTAPFLGLEDGVRRYLDALHAGESAPTGRARVPA
jgi:ADP-L-glycero-D-manno-heptose 6-epimerase